MGSGWLGQSQVLGAAGGPESTTLPTLHPEEVREIPEVVVVASGCAGARGRDTRLASVLGEEKLIDL